MHPSASKQTVAADFIATNIEAPLHSRFLNLPGHSLAIAAAKSLFVLSHLRGEQKC